MKRVLTIPVSDIDRINDILQDEGITSSDIVKIDQIGNQLKIVTGVKWWGSGSTPTPSFNRTFWYQPLDTNRYQNNTWSGLLVHSQSITPSIDGVDRKIFSIFSARTNYPTTTTHGTVHQHEYDLKGQVIPAHKRMRMEMRGLDDLLSVSSMYVANFTSSFNFRIANAGFSNSPQMGTQDISSFHLLLNENEGVVQTDLEYTSPTSNFSLDTSFSTNEFHTIYSGSVPSSGEFLILFNGCFGVSSTSNNAQYRVKINDIYYTTCTLEKNEINDRIPYNTIIEATLDEGDLVEIQLLRTTGTTYLQVPSITFLKKNQFKKIYSFSSSIEYSSSLNSFEFEDAFFTTFNIERPNNLHWILLSSKVKNSTDVTRTKYSEFLFKNKTEDIQYGGIHRQSMLTDNIYKDMFNQDVVTFQTNINEIGMQFRGSGSATTHQSFTKDNYIYIIDLGVTEEQHINNLIQSETDILSYYSNLSSVTYSLRKYNNNYTGSCIKIRRDNDNLEQDFGFVNGFLDTSSVLNFVGENSGYVVNWYDQSGNNNHSFQDNNLNQPYIVSSGSFQTLNDNVCISFRDTSSEIEDFLKIPIYHNVSSSYVAFFLVAGIRSSGYFPYIIGGGDGDSGFQLGLNTTTRAIRPITIRISGGGVTTGTTITLNSINLIGAIANRTNLRAFLNGNFAATITDGDSDFVLPSNNYYYMGNRGGNGGPETSIDICEFIAFDRDVENYLYDFNKLTRKKYNI